MKEPKPGDKIKVITPKKEYYGILLESPEKGIIMIKLSSGYNIGFIKKNILKIELIEEKKEIEQEKISIYDNSKPDIALIVTGGTIASKYDSKTGGVKWLDNPENLFRFYPEIFNIANIPIVEVPFMKGSENLEPKDWQKIAIVAEKLLNKKNVEGIIITHGTDTLHYTSSALSFFLGDLNKPVVLTYSQRSIDRASSDANLNLQCAARMALSDCAEVIIVGHATTNDDYCLAIRGTKTRKMHTSRRDAFKPVNQSPIAKVYPDKIEYLTNFKKRNKNKVTADTKFEEKIAIIKFYPGQDPSILEYYQKKKYKGLIIEMLGLGHVATSESTKNWLKALKKVQEKNMIICATAQTIYGRLNPLVYSTGREILETGVIYLEDMLTETAFVKLGWVLGHKEWSKNKIKEKMLENISNELNPRLEE